MIVYAKDRIAQRKENLRGGRGVSYLRDMIVAGSEEAPGNYQLFTEVEYLPGTYVGNHQHVGNSEVYYILEGIALYNDNGTEVELRPGDTSICKDGEYHAIKNIGEGSLRIIAMIIDS